MMKRVLLLLLFAGLVASLIFAGCAKPAPTPTPTPTATPTGPTEIPLGVIAPLTGPMAVFGQGGTFGLQAAADDINKQGGIFVKELNRKLPVRLIVLDDLSDAAKAGTLAEDLILRDHVNFLVSSGDTPPACASEANVAEKYKMPLLGDFGPFEVYNAIRSQVSPPWNYVWATGFHIAAPASPGDFRAGKPGYTLMDLGAILIDQFGAQTNKKTAIFASDEPDGRGFYSGFAPALKSLGLDVVGVDKELGLAPPDTMDFTSIITQWKAYNCEIMWGNALAPWFGTLWRQCHEQGFKPKLVYAGRAALYYTDVNAWGGDLPWGVGCEQLWSPSYDPKVCPGIGDTTSQSLHDRWVKAKNQPLNQGVGWAYQTAQVLFDAIQRAGTLDKDKVNAALAQTDLMTLCGRVVYDESHFSQFATSWGQWFKTDKAYKWEFQTVVSVVDFIPTTAKPLFPIPYP